MKQRLEQFLEAENLTKAQFADSINVARAGISHIMSGRNNPSYEFIVNTMEAYPLLNIEWLLTGRGRMYKDEGTEIVENDLFSSSFDEKPKMASNSAQHPNTDEVRNSMKSFDSDKKTKRIVLFYNDGTYEEFC